MWLASSGERTRGLRQPREHSNLYAVPVFGDQAASDEVGESRDYPARVCNFTLFSRDELLNNRQVVRRRLLRLERPAELLRLLV
jgi:hypothetical protein